jgi:hypothetical protein
MAIAQTGKKILRFYYRSVSFAPTVVVCFSVLKICQPQVLYKSLNNFQCGKATQTVSIYMYAYLYKH